LPHPKEPRKLNLRNFKTFVATNFDERTALYKVVTSEKDEISPQEFAAKFDTWLKLASLSLPASPKE
jgi:hypothetical protein